MHLWEIDHEYYCQSETYNQNYNDSASSPREWKSWHEFYQIFKDAELYSNLFFRFDWLEGEANDLPEFNGDINYRNGLLKLHMIYQGKGLFFTHHIEVCRADEEEIKKFLAKCFIYLVNLWKPINVS